MFNKPTVLRCSEILGYDCFLYPDFLACLLDFFIIWFRLLTKNVLFTPENRIYLSHASINKKKVKYSNSIKE